MTWYTGVYGNWDSAEGVRRIEGTNSRKEITERAQKIADEKNVIVTIHCQRGMNFDFFDVRPSEWRV